MHCERVTTEDGKLTGFVCMSGRRPKPKPCSSCGEPGTFLCDASVTRRGKVKTCDKPICDGCRTVVGEDRDLCPTHAPPREPKRHGRDEVLHAWTARMGITDPDHLDVTCQGNIRRKEPGGHRGIGVYFAPPPELLYPYVSKARSEGLTEEDARRYAAAYMAEMRSSYRRSRPAWDELLSWSRVVLLCFCVDAERCHRTVLARDILTKLGAIYEGEVAR